jgi:hypothetical protein
MYTDCLRELGVPKEAHNIPVFQLLELKSEDENLRIYEFRPT